MMVGLPGAGKTHWAQTHMKQHPEKRYMMLGTATVLACMRVRTPHTYNVIELAIINT